MASTTKIRTRQTAPTDRRSRRGRLGGGSGEGVGGADTRSERATSSGDKCMCGDSTSAGTRNVRTIMIAIRYISCEIFCNGPVAIQRLSCPTNPTPLEVHPPVQLSGFREIQV